MHLRNDLLHAIQSTLSTTASADNQPANGCFAARHPAAAAHSS